MAARDILAQEWGSTMEDFRSHSLESQVNFEFVQHKYNTVGLLLKEKMIDPNVLYQIKGPRRIMMVWEMIEQIIQDYRELYNEPSFLEPFEYLYNETKKRFPDTITRPRAHAK